MEKVKFSKKEKEIIIQKIQHYFVKELQQEIGQFDAEFLLQFFAEEFGIYFYNKGLFDAQAILSKRMDDISAAIYELEQPTSFRR